MNEEQFYNVANAGTIREAVANLITTNPILSKLEGKDYYDVEDSICSLIQKEQYDIASFVKGMEARNIFECIYEGDFDKVPESLKDSMVSDYLDALNDDDETRSNLADWIINDYKDELAEYQDKFCDVIFCDKIITEVKTFFDAYRTGACPEVILAQVYKLNFLNQLSDWAENINESCGDEDLKSLSQLVTLDNISESLYDYYTGCFSPESYNIHTFEGMDKLVRDFVQYKFELNKEV